MDIEKLAAWTPPREVQTKFGTRILRKAPVSDDFWTVWRSDKEVLKKAGVTCGKDERTGEWQIVWWQGLPETVKAHRAESLAASSRSASDAPLLIAEGQSYMPFQRAGIEYALARPNVLIADEMGLGKTIQALGIVSNDPTIRRVLIICPASLKLNWEREARRFLARPMTIARIEGAWSEADITIINYDRLKAHKASIDAVAWDLLICDEAHYLKGGTKTLRGQMVLGRKQKRGESEGTELKPIQARRVAMLTGTPIVNRPMELHPIIASLDPQWAEFFPFAKRYCGAKQGRFGWDFTGATNLEELQRRLRETIMVRRLKRDVLTELPAKRRQVVELEQTHATAGLVERENAISTRLAEDMASLRRDAEAAKVNGTEDDYRAAVARLRDTAQVAFENMAQTRIDLGVAKVPQVIAHLREIMEGQPEYKVVVFAHHHAVVDAIMEAANSEGWNPVKVTGEVALDARQRAVDAFQNDPATRIFVGNIKAAGVGLTLTASAHVVFAELDWVPGNVTQAEDRCHRIGQHDSVLVQHLVVDDSLDSRMAHTIVRKQRIIDAALDDPIAQADAEAEIAVEIQPRTDSTERGVVEVATRREIEQEAALIPPDIRLRAHAALRIIAGYDPDHAANLNGVGFNSADSYWGHMLADLPTLTDRQAAVAVRMARRYRRQLPEALQMPATI